MIVVDTNVIVRGIRSGASASGFILRALLLGEIRFAISPAMILEYEDVLKRPGVLAPLILSTDQIDAILDALCRMAHCVTPWFRYRPLLEDPKDDLYIECAVAAGADVIISHDRHFQNPEMGKLGLRVMSAREYVIEYRNLRSSQ